MPQLSAPPYWHLQQAVPSPPSSQMCFPWRAKGSKPLLQKPSSPGALRFPLPGKLPLLPKVKVLDPTKSTQTMDLASSSGLVENMHIDTFSSPRPLFPSSLPLTPLATPLSSNLPSLPATLKTPTVIPPKSSSPQTLNPSLSPLPTKLYKALIPLPQLRPSTTWDYYICMQGMQVPCPLYHKVKVKKGRKTTKKPKKYRLLPEEFREQEMRALVEMQTSGYMLTCQVLGKMLASQHHQKGTK